MQCQTFTLRLDNAKDLEQLNAFLGRVVPIQISSSLVQGQSAFWSVLVFHEGGEAPAEPARKPKPKEPARPERIFESSNPVVFEALRQWRSAKARQEGLPPYAVATNSELEEVIKANPTSPEGLEAVRGFGRVKREKYGGDILAILNQH